MNIQCLICGDMIGRKHLKVAACRACAVFFRRSLRNNGRRYKCRVGYKSCNLKIKGQPLCKYCRFEKCKELGMKLLRRNKQKPPTSPKINAELRPKVSTLPYPENAQDTVLQSPSAFSLVSPGSINSEKQMYDMKPIELQIKDILAQPPTCIYLAPMLRLTFLQQLCVGFPEFLETISTSETIVKIADEFDRLQHIKFQEKFLLALAKLLMKCDNFSELCFYDKWLLYKNSWMVFYKIERFYTSVQLFGTSLNDHRIVYYGTTALDYSNKNIRLKDMETGNNKQWNNYWNPLRNKYIKCVLNPLKKMKLSQFELTYILARILWNVGDLDDLSEKACRIAEEVSSQISSELHHYYTNEAYLLNYADRLTNINKMIAATESILRVRKDLGVVAEIFNLWDLVIVGTELCDAG